MDTVLRDGKVVYSQGCWLLGLSGFANLLNLVDKKRRSTKNTINRDTTYKFHRIQNVV